MNNSDYLNQAAHQMDRYAQGLQNQYTRPATIEEQLTARRDALTTNLSKVDEWKRELATVNRMLEAAKEPQ